MLPEGGQAGRRGLEGTAYADRGLSGATQPGRGCSRPGLRPCKVAPSPNSVSGPRGQPEVPRRSPGWFWSPTQGAERKRLLLYVGNSLLIDNVQILGAGRSLVSLCEDATGHQPVQP